MTDKEVTEADLLSKELGMFRYAPFIDVCTVRKYRIRFGGTPLTKCPKRPAIPFKGDLFIKNESLNPTNSMKDRSAAYVCLKALEMGKTTIVTATSGNAGASISMASNLLGMNCNIFVPSDAPLAKICQAMTYGAKTFLVEGEYDDAVTASEEAAQNYDWFYVNQLHNKYPIEGMKTVSYEICEQITEVYGKTSSGKWKVPNYIICPVGEGTVVTSLYRGLEDLKRHKFIEEMPKIIGVQAVGSNSLTICWNEFNGDPDKIPTVEIDTIADSLACRYPGEGVTALEAIRSTNGTFYDATNEELLQAMVEMAQNSGILPEPASATAWVGMKKATEDGLLKPNHRVVLVCTGNGLKDTASLDKAMKYTIPTTRVNRNLSVVGK